jgi:hypothetical protein
MKRYGQNLVYGPLTAPGIFTGEVISYDYNSQATQQNIEGAASDYIAMAIHSLKGELNFEVTVTDGTTNFLDLSDAKAAITVDDAEITAGMVLCSEAVEKWQLLQPKTCSIRATHYPDMVNGGDEAVVTLNAFSPAQVLTGLLFPGSGLIFSTVGLTHAAGVVHALTLTQSLTITEDDPSPAGQIVGAATHGYQRKISLDLLAGAAAATPAVGTVLTIAGAPAHAGGYRIISAAHKLGRLKGKMYAIEAAWIPPFAV